MKKKLLFPLAVSSFALLVGLTACGGGHNEGGESKGSDEPGTVETARKILNASIKKPVIELDQRTKVLCDVEGVSYHSDNALMVVWHVLLSVKKAILIKY